MSAGTERGTEQRPDTDSALDVSRPSILRPVSRPAGAPGPSRLRRRRGGGRNAAARPRYRPRRRPHGGRLRLAMWGTSRVVEGPRKAADRLVTVVVTVAFLIAMAPLVSVVVTVLANGIARFDAQFFTYSMRESSARAAVRTTPSSGQ